MSLTSYSNDSDLQHIQNPSTRPQGVQVLPVFQNLHPPINFAENQLFMSTMATDHTQQAYFGQILDKHVPIVNYIISTNTSHEINTVDTRSAGTRIHQHQARPNYISPETKKSTHHNAGGSTARKGGKKDRHSKINTAQGLRDRRMRLSVQIAQQFFDLQDRLGFDRASKTLDWLFSQSKKAIKQLSYSAASGSHVPQINSNIISQKGSKSGEKSQEKRKKVKTAASEQVECDENQKSGKSTKCNEKEMRCKARSRARERTKEKMMIKCIEKSKYINNQDYNLAQLLGPAENPNPLFAIRQEYAVSNSSSTQETISTSQSSVHHHELALAEPLGGTASSMYEIYGDLFSVGSGSYSNNIQYLETWELFNSEYSNPNSINFLDNYSGYDF